MPFKAGFLAKYNLSLWSILFNSLKSHLIAFTISCKILLASCDFFKQKYNPSYTASKKIYTKIITKEEVQVKGIIVMNSKLNQKQWKQNLLKFRNPKFVWDALKNKHFLYKNIVFYAFHGRKNPKQSVIIHVKLKKHTK